MPGPIRSQNGLGSKIQNQKMRAKGPLGRSSTLRADSVTPSSATTLAQSEVVSPSGSIASMPPSKPRSPGSRHTGTKRKEREFEEDSYEETNINVVVRCRGRNERELRENSGVVLSTEGAKGRSLELSMGPNAVSNKTYHFDKVFSPAADQTMVYEDVVAPILDEMLQGFNCTIFAYGQTGTGKTYTMSGDMTDTLGLLSDSAGIIPRVLSSLFRNLESEEVESSIKCSFIELYNEELRDLLAVEENTKLKIFEDGQRKGNGATIIHGMEESHIKSARDGIKLLQEGSHKRQVAATKCNDLSSRSHTVFTITAYIKRAAENGEDFVVGGKLNLVDLAGSENIQRSGAENKRATEAGLINKSLLTLGRVINALVDRSSHIPYRESKLTRLLQDSLGGRTKTCIIATVSPAKSNLEETISTLDYAFRAKNIRNKPQMNQLISKKTLLKDFTAEIEKLKGELIAARQRNGVYLTNEAFETMTVESESRRILNEEQKARIETMEASLRNKVQELFNLTNDLTTLKKDTEATRQVLDSTNEVLQKTEIVLENTRKNLAEETLLRKAHQSTEEELNKTGMEIISVLKRAVQDNDGLHAKLRRKSDLQSINKITWRAFQSQISKTTQLVESRIEGFKSGQQVFLEQYGNEVEHHTNEQLAAVESQAIALDESSRSFSDLLLELSQQNGAAHQVMDNTLGEISELREDVKAKVGKGLQDLSVAAERISADVIQEFSSYHTQHHNSYSSLGRELKSAFDGLVKSLRAQKAEAEGSCAKLAMATTNAIKADVSCAQALNACLEEERKTAAVDRQKLLSQISSLIQAQDADREERLAAKIASIRGEKEMAKSQLESAAKRFSENMDAWALKEDSLMEDYLQWRETLRKKLKEDWSIADEHNKSIQIAANGVHAETIRIVDTQMEEIGTQMQSFDNFVTKAKAANESNRSKQAEILERTSKTVLDNRSSAEVEARLARSRLHAFEDTLSSNRSTLACALPALDSSIREPLVALRIEMEAADLVEYQSTGDTPQKAQYPYPHALRRTESHERLLGRRPDSIGLGACSTERLAELPEGLPSPSKSIVYNDASTNDELNRTTMRPSTSDGSLREIHVNVNAGPARSSEPTYTTLLPNASKLVRGDIDKLSSSLTGVPPPLKRHATDANGVGSKQGRDGGGGGGNTRGVRAGSAAFRSDGRENSVLTFSASVGSGRRLRSHVQN